MDRVNPCPLSTLAGRLIVIALLGFSLAAPGLSQQSFLVEGQVLTDRGGVPPTRINVRVETSNGQVVAEQTADSKGWFRIGVQRGMFRLIVTAPGFAAFQESLRVYRGSSRNFVTVTLRPLIRAKPSGDVVSVSDLSAPKKARKAYQKGERAFQQGELLEAQKKLEKAVELHPCYARPHLRLGMTHKLLGDFGGAERALKKAVECDKNLLEAHVQLGILLIHQEKYAESAAHTKEALRHSPEAWQLHYQLAAAEYGLGRYQEAVRELRKAQSIAPAVPAEIHIRLANVYAQLGNYEKAHSELEAYLRIEPEGRFAAEATALRRQIETAGLVRSGGPRRAQNLPRED